MALVPRKELHSSPLPFSHSSSKGIIEVRGNICSDAEAAFNSSAAWLPVEGHTESRQRAAVSFR